MRWHSMMVICLEQGADCLHMGQLMPLAISRPIISCLIKIVLLYYVLWGLVSSLPRLVIS